MKINEQLSGKLFATLFSLLFSGIGAMRMQKVIELLFNHEHNTLLYDTSEIYADFGAKGYCVFYGIVGGFFIGIGMAFFYLGVLKRNKYEGYGEQYQLNMQRILN
jgi:hypothetical protein